MASPAGTSGWHTLARGSALPSTGGLRRPIVWAPCPNPWSASSSRRSSGRRAWRRPSTRSRSPNWPIASRSSSSTTPAPTTLQEVVAAREGRFALASSTGGGTPMSALSRTGAGAIALARGAVAEDHLVRRRDGARVRSPIMLETAERNGVSAVTCRVAIDYPTGPSSTATSTDPPPSRPDIVASELLALPRGPAVVARRRPRPHRRRPDGAGAAAAGHVPGEGDRARPVDHLLGRVHRGRRRAPARRPSAFPGRRGLDHDAIRAERC